MASLDGKVALITGAARGIGAAEASLLAEHGATVVIADLRDEQGRAHAAAIEAQGGKAAYVHLDVTSEEEWAKVAAGIEAGHGRLDILVNTAGINLRGPIATTTAADFATMMAVNVMGPMLGMKHCAPVIARAGGGAIVNITSNVSLIPSRGASYTASKWGLRGLSKVAALEYAKDKIRVNCVCPGVVPTDLNKGQPYLETTAGVTPLGRIATAGDIAQAVLFLVSDAGAFITGLDMPVDGGFTLGKAG
ncbi:MAG: SDR family oxidoreductase [Rhizobiales bacterium]|nr:SDR family oxidoreductase [Hyphomicrobiales bacterium]